MFVWRGVRFVGGGWGGGGLGLLFDEGMRLISAQEEAGIWWWLTFLVFESFTWYGEQGLICILMMRWSYLKGSI